MVVCFNNNLNASRPSEHPPVREKMSKCSGGIIDCKYQTSSSWYDIQFRCVYMSLSVPACGHSIVLYVGYEVVLVVNPAAAAADDDGDDDDGDDDDGQLNMEKYCFSSVLVRG